jgi:hypothetical protein
LKIFSAYPKRFVAYSGELVPRALIFSTVTTTKDFLSKMHPSRSSSARIMKAHLLPSPTDMMAGSVQHPMMAVSFPDACREISQDPHSELLNAPLFPTYSHKFPVDNSPSFQTTGDAVKLLSLTLGDFRICP